MASARRPRTVTAVTGTDHQLHTQAARCSVILAATANGHAQAVTVTGTTPDRRGATGVMLHLADGRDLDADRVTAAHPYVRDEARTLAAVLATLHPGPGIYHPATRSWTPLPDPGPQP